MQVLIYGGGAVGLGLASFLLEGGASVDLLARPDTAAALSENGLQRKGVRGAASHSPDDFQVFTNLHDCNKCYDFIFVCTKAHGAEVAANDLYENLLSENETTKIVLFHNGWGTADVFAKYFDQKRIYNARVLSGYARPHLNEVDVTVYASPIHIGNIFTHETASLEVLCGCLNGAIPCAAVPDVEKDLWAKMLYNCALNPLAAILGVPYGQLTERDEINDMMDEIIEEIFALAQVAGISMHWENADAYFDLFYNELVPATAAHKSSMLQDIEAGHPTEIDWLNGAVFSLAQKYNLDVPVNESVMWIVKYLESKGELPDQAKRLVSTMTTH